MNIPKKIQKEIIEGVLVMLRDAYEEVENVKQYKGSSLKNFMNAHTDDKGRPIIDSMNYTIKVKESVKINHERRMRHIIEQAASMDIVEKELGDYLAKYAKSKEEVVEQIPAHLRKKK